ncbi:MAG: two component regulator sensor protein [Limisphaerales bacterium]|nr:MAG: two component regulator sensor protein [Limisphaerales bacterium]
MWLLTAATGVAAPPEFLLQSWQVEEGLPHNIVNHVLQDRAGYLWVATSGGLVRFNGVEFKEFPLPTATADRVQGVYGLHEEADGALLLLVAGNRILRLKDGQFTRHPASGAVNGRNAVTLFGGPRGALWVGYAGGALKRWADDRAELLNPDQSPGAWGVPSFVAGKNGGVWIAGGGFLGQHRDGKLTPFPDAAGTQLRIAASGAGGLWVGSREQLHRLDAGVLAVVSEVPPWAGANVQSLLEDRDGALWIGTDTRGLFRFKDGEFASVPVTHPQVMGICQDREGNLWVATRGGGLNRVRPRPFQMFDAVAGLGEDESRSVCEGRPGEFWFANRGGGLARLKDGRVEVLSQRKGWPQLFVNIVCPDARGNVWLLADTGIHRVTGETVRRVEVARPGGVRVLFGARNGDVWMGGEEGLLGRFQGDAFQAFTEADGFTARQTRAFAEDAEGRVWIGTAEGDVFAFHDGVFTRHSRDDGLPGAAIRVMRVDSGGVLWAGTVGGGLLARVDGRFRRLTDAHGLPADYISQVLEDGRGRMWFGSYRGIFHVARKELLACARGETRRVNAVTFGKSEGLPGVSCLGEDHQPAAWPGRDGRLWLATRKGVLAIDPAVERPNTNPPPVVIEEFLLDGQRADARGALKIPPDARKLDFRVAVLSYASPEKIRVRHKLDGFDSDWVEAGAQRTLTYPKPSPGTYRLRVIAANNDGLWNETGATLAFTVVPAWWQTWWFLAAAVLAGAGAVGGAVRFITRRRWQRRMRKLEAQHALERERTRIAQDIHDDLGASLTEIAWLGELAEQDAGDPGEVRAQARKISSTARETVRSLDEIVWAVRPESDTLKGLIEYLGRRADELFESTPVRCWFTAPAELPDLPLAADVRHDFYLACKEALHNVLKHAHATEVRVELALAGTTLRARVTDNGRGFDASAARADGNGLRNMRQRIERLGGRFELRSAAGQGTTVEMTITLKQPVPA